MTDLPRASLSKLKELKPRDLMIRFAFGAALSAIAGVIRLIWNARAAGMFLAFPAILPATLTLIEKKGSKREAEEDDEGAMLGSVAMLAFAAVGVWTLDTLASGLALALAAAAWLVTAGSLYFLLALVRRRAAE